MAEIVSVSHGPRETMVELSPGMKRIIGDDPKINKCADDYAVSS
jgi:hypothetical protein